MQLSEIYIRDPFILTSDNKYYMYGSRVNTRISEDALDVYIGENLADWSEPKTILRAENGLKGVEAFWAPEVHEYNGRYYMFVTIKRKYERRGTCICVCDTPDGEFRLHSDGAVTPSEWECLDGTLYIEDGKPYMVFCHEWVQAVDGRMCATELSSDLCRPVGEPFELFRASDNKNIVCYPRENYVTDGPFLFKEDGALYMMWSSFAENRESGYIISLAYSESGSILGEWKHYPKILFGDNGGHGMIFRDLDGNRRLTLHTPNSFADPHVAILDFVKNSKGDYSVK